MFHIFTDLAAAWNDVLSEWLTQTVVKAEYNAMMPNEADAAAGQVTNPKKEKAAKVPPAPVAWAASVRVPDGDE